MATSGSRLQEGEQVGVQLVPVRFGKAVRRARVDLQGPVPNELRRGEGGGADRHDLVFVAMHDKRRNVELLEIPGEVCLRERLDTGKHIPVAAQHPLKPERIPHALGGLAPVERHGNILE